VAPAKGAKYPIAKCRPIIKKEPRTLSGGLKFEFKLSGAERVGAFPPQFIRLFHPNCGMTFNFFLKIVKTYIKMSCFMSFFKFKNSQDNSTGIRI
jgi:hypothetical protein